MSELNKVLYQTIKGDAECRILMGSTTQDPRVYKTRTPIKIEITDTKPCYIIYFTSGTTKRSSSDEITIAQRNDRTYALEVYGKKDTDVERLCDRIERLFRDEEFMTDSYKIGYVYATRGRVSWDDSRSLYLETMMVFFTKVLALNLAS